MQRALEVETGDKVSYGLDAIDRELLDRRLSRLERAANQLGIERCCRVISGLGQRIQYRIEQCGFDVLPRGLQPLERTFQVPADAIGGLLRRPVGIVELSGQVDQGLLALPDQRPQPRTGGFPERQDRRVAGVALGGQLPDHFAEVAGGDAQRGQFLTGGAGGIGELGQDGGQRGAGLFAFDASVGERRQRADGLFQIQTCRASDTAGGGQGLRQSAGAGGADVRALGQYIGHLAGLFEAQSHDRQRVGELLRRRVHADPFGLGQGQHRRQGLHDLRRVQAGGGQRLHALRGFGAGQSELRADLDRRFFELLHALGGVVALGLYLVELGLEFLGTVQPAAEQTGKGATNLAGNNRDFRIKKLQNGNNAKNRGTDQIACFEKQLNNDG